MAVYIAAVVVATAFGIVVGLVAWRKFLAEWGNVLGPVALLSIIAIATAGLLIVSIKMIKRRAERQKAEAAGLALYGRPSSATLSADLLLPLVHDPRLLARLEAIGATSGPEAGLSLVERAGVARLDDEMRVALFDIRRSLAGSSLDVCAALWTGSVDPQELSSAIRKLDETAQRRWIGILAHAAEMELAATSAPAHIPGATRDAAMMELATTLPAEARAAFDRASKAERPTPEEACAAFRVLAEGLTLVAPATRQILLRIVMNPEIVDTTR